MKSPTSNFFKKRKHKSQNTKNPNKAQNKKTQTPCLICAFMSVFCLVFVFFVSVLCYYQKSQLPFRLLDCV